MKATNNQLNLSLSINTSALLATRKENEKYYSNRRFKKELDTYIAENFGDEELLVFLDGIEDANKAYATEYVARKALPHSDIKPKTKGMNKVKRELAYRPYNNGKIITKLEEAVKISSYFFESIDLKKFKTLHRSLLMAHLKSLRGSNKGSFVSNVALNAFTNLLGIGIDEVSLLGSGQIMEILTDCNIIRRTKTSTANGRATFMIKTGYKNVSDLFVSFIETRKESVRFTAPKDINENSWIMGRNAKMYSASTLSPALIYSINKLNSMKIAFADWVTVDDVRIAVINKLTKDGKHPVANWMNNEADYAVIEFLAVKESGNVFYIEHFTDGVNRIYEYRSYFGFQEGSAFRSMLRFADKHAVTEKGIKAYKAAAKEMYGSDKPASILALDSRDKWGYANAIANPIEPTGSVVFQDATSQGTGIYGLVTGDEGLLTLGGFTEMDSKYWRKAYEVLAEELNILLSVHYTGVLGKEIYLNCFNVLNIKSINMTKLYNVGDLRIMTGKGYNPEIESDEIDIDVDLSSLESGAEFVRTNEINGKDLVPLLQTVRDAGLDINYDDMLDLFNKAIRAVVPYALRAMNSINAVVKDKDSRTMFEWKSFDGTINRYAMTETVDIVTHWVTQKGYQHQLTHSMQAFRPLSAWRGVAPRLVQGIDAQFVRYVLNVCVFDVATIHDSFGSHGNNAEEVSTAYITSALRVFDNDEGTDMLQQIHGKDIVSLQRKDINRKEIRTQILNGKYSIMFA